MSRYSNYTPLATALALVGERERNEARVIAIELTEHGSYMRCIAVDIGNHHDDVAWLQVSVGTETSKQLIVEDFHFALSAVSNMETN